MDEQTTGERLLTNRDVCGQLGVSDNTLRTLRKTGRLPYRRIGNQVRYTQDDVEAFVESCKAVD